MKTSHSEPRRPKQSYPAVLGSVMPAPKLVTRVRAPDPQYVPGRKLYQLPAPSFIRLSAKLLEHVRYDHAAAVGFVAKVGELLALGPIAEPQAKHGVRLDG